MAHVLLEYHIKVKKSEGAFKVIPTILMHYYSGMLDSDLKIIEGQKESCMRTKIASMTYHARHLLARSEALDAVDARRLRQS